jgi:hypothetical protein
VRQQLVLFCRCPAGSDWPLLADSTHAAPRHKAAAVADQGIHVRPTLQALNLSLLGGLQRVIDLDAKVSNSVLQLGLTEQELVEREIPRNSILGILQKRGLQVQDVGL